MTKTIVTEIYLNGMSPQRAIKHLTNLISRTKLKDKRFLRIEEYEEDYGNPFEQNPVRALRLVIDRSFEERE